MATELLDTASSDWYKKRLTGVVLCALGAFFVLFIRLFYLQVIQGEELQRLSETNCIRLQTIEPVRGLIFDRHGHMLADNRPAFDLRVTVKDAKPLDQTLTKLGNYLNLPADEMEAGINRLRHVTAYKPVTFKQDIGRDALAVIETSRYDLPGVDVNVKTLRHYINNQAAAHLLGYLSQINARELEKVKDAGYAAGDFIGKFGTEKAYENYLRGKRGGRQVEVNARGQVVKVLKTVEAHAGLNLYLTLDLALQKKAETLLQGVSGAVVAMDPNNGHILALASSPSFDQNLFVSGMSHHQWQTLTLNPMRPMENKAVQGEYPPASTYKIITAIAGLEEKVIDTTTSVFCPGHYRFGNRVFRCWKRGGHGWVTIKEALAESCDVYFYQAGEKLGVDRLAWYAKASGFGTPTQIGLDREASGLIPTAAWKKKRFGIPWMGGETLSVAIGQGYNLVTPLQMARLTAAFANGGTIYQPLIVGSIRDHAQAIISESKPKVAGKLPAGQETMRIVRDGLWEVVNGAKGTARSVRLETTEVIGKTGTAQVVGRRAGMPPGEAERFLHLKAHAWFVAYAPAQQPEIAIAVLVENGEHGSSVAPIARELIRTYQQSSATKPDLPATVQILKQNQQNTTVNHEISNRRHLAIRD